MDFLVRSEAAPAAMEAEDDPALDERHWTYIDDHTLITRGPTLGVDRYTWTGSIHVELSRTGGYLRSACFALNNCWRQRT